MSTKKTTFTAATFFLGMVGMGLMVGVGQVAQASLVSHWMLDEEAGTIVANEVGSIDGANNGAAVGHAGVAGTAYQFDGNSIIDTGFHPVPAEGDFSLFMWIKGAPGQGSRILAGGHNGQAGRWTFQFSTAEGNPLMFFHNGGGSNAARSLKPLDNEWHHVGLTRQGETITLWLDGQSEVVMTEFSHSLNDDHNFTLGARGTGENPVSGYAGLMDDVQIYGTALTQSEVGWLIANPGQAIPEPASLGLAASGLVMLLGRRGNRGRRVYERSQRSSLLLQH